MPRIRHLSYHVYDNEPEAKESIRHDKPNSKAIFQEGGRGGVYFSFRGKTYLAGYFDFSGLLKEVEKHPESWREAMICLDEATEEAIMLAKEELASRMRSTV